MNSSEGDVDEFKAARTVAGLLLKKEEFLDGLPDAFHLLYCSMMTMYRGRFETDSLPMCNDYHF